MFKMFTPIKIITKALWKGLDKVFLPLNMERVSDRKLSQKSLSSFATEKLSQKSLSSFPILLAARNQGGHIGCFAIWPLSTLRIVCLTTFVVYCCCCGD